MLNYELMEKARTHGAKHIRLSKSKKFQNLFFSLGHCVCLVGSRQNLDPEPPNQLSPDPVHWIEPEILFVLLYAMVYGTLLYIHIYFFLLGLAGGVLPSPLLTHQYAEYNNWSFSIFCICSRWIALITTPPFLPSDNKIPLSCVASNSFLLVFGYPYLMRFHCQKYFYVWQFFTLWWPGQGLLNFFFYLQFAKK